MEDPFVEIAEGESNRTADSAGGSAAPSSGPQPGHASHHSAVPAPASGVPSRPLPRHVCPFCGATTGTGQEPCPRCTMEDTPATRQATKARIGPWFVLQSRNPAAPGMKYSTLIALVHKGQITPRSVVRGPTTHQLWRLAIHVRGLSREFGMCYSCGEAIDHESVFCVHCERPQEPPENPDQLIEQRETNRKQQAVPAPQVQQPMVLAEPRERGFSDRLRPAAEINAARPKPETMRGNGRNVSAMELAVALQNDDPGKPPRRVARVMLVLMVLAFIAAAAYLWQRPDHKAIARDWIITHWNTSVQKFNDWRATPAPIAVPSVVKPADTTLPAATTTAQNPQATPPKVDRPAVDPPVEPVVLSAEEALTQARSLWRKALEAEGAGNFKEAVRCYEAIEKLPRDAWPGGLQPNLRLARERTK